MLNEYPGHSVACRGAGADKAGTVFDTENSLVASRYGILFEDMNDSNTRRFDKLPVYYSAYPMSFAGCNFRFLQGAFINGNDAILMANLNDEVFRGYMFSPNGIDDTRNTATGSFNVNTFGYNVSPGINESGKQLSGTEDIGRIGSFEYANFPRELVNKLADSEKFLSDLSSEKHGFAIGETTETPGLLTLGKYIFADGDINITADSITDGGEASVIASKNGNITITATEADIKAAVYAPNGRITVNGDVCEIKGRLFAKSVMINAAEFDIDAGEGDVRSMTFTDDGGSKDKPADEAKSGGDKSKDKKDDTSSNGKTDDGSSGKDKDKSKDKDKDKDDSASSDSSDTSIADSTDGKDKSGESSSSSDSGSTDKGETAGKPDSTADSSSGSGSGGTSSKSDNSGSENPQSNTNTNTNTNNNGGSSGNGGSNSSTGSNPPASDTSSGSGNQSGSNGGSGNGNSGSSGNTGNTTDSTGNTPSDNSSSQPSGGNGGGTGSSTGGSESTADSTSPTDTSSSSGSSSTPDTPSPDDSRIDAAGEPKFEYDLLNRLVKVVYDENNYIEYTYDTNGNITKIKTVVNGRIQ